MKCLILLHFIAIIYMNNAEERIIGGTVAKNVLPYQVQLRLKSDEQFLCSGIIICKNYILTAAHCFLGINATDVIVVVGTNSLKEAGPTYEISKLIPHDDFELECNFDLRYCTDVWHDIGVMKTATPIIFDDKVHAIRLYKDQVPENAKMYVSGWGLVRSHRDKTLAEMPVDLYILEMYAINLDACKEMYEEFNVTVDLTESDICGFNSPNHGACVGDSGGPLVYQNRLVGIVSRITGDCASGLPDIYTKVGPYYEWIKRNVRH